MTISRELMVGINLDIRQQHKIESEYSTSYYIGKYVLSCFSSTLNGYTY